MAIDGVITQNSVLVRQGGRMVRLPITREPIVAQVQEVSSEDVPQKSKPFFTWSDETIGGTWTATGRLHRNWIQPEEDWIRTGC